LTVWRRATVFLPRTRPSFVVGRSSCTAGRPDHHLEHALIAATALVLGLTVLTRNVDDFEPFGVPLINPFVGTADTGKSP
jgi:hypothetical protein